MNKFPNQLYLLTILLVVDLFIDVYYESLTWMIILGHLLGVFIILFTIILIIRASKTRTTIQKKQDEYKLIADNMTDLILIIDMNGIIQYASPSFETNLNICQSMIIEGRFQDFLDAEKLLQFDAIIQRLIQFKNSIVEEFCFYQDNRCLAFELKFTPVMNEDQQVHRAVIVAQDITERKRTLDMLMETEEKYRILVEKSLVGVYITQEEKFLYVNPRMSQILGYTQDEMVGQDIMNFIKHEHRPFVAEKSRERRERPKKSLKYQFQAIHKDSSFIDVEVYGSEIMYHGNPAVIGSLLNITDQVRSQEKINFLASHDALTGLPNRHALNETFQQFILRGSVNKNKIAVLFLDLDRFKLINDTLGHNFGDLLLIEVSKILRSCVPEGTIFRYGGDEFTILLDRIQNEATLASVAQRILQQFKQAISVSDQFVYITTSIGISIYPADGLDTETLLKNADTAMYIAKDRGKNNYQFYTTNMYDQMTRQMKLENDLRNALEHDEFTIFYQPQLNIVNNTVVAAEALIRWNHPALGIISPEEFIPLAEETWLIIPIGNWVLQTACFQNKQWQNAGYEPITVSVNISLLQFNQESFYESVLQTLKETKLDPKYLNLEITESIAKYDMKQVIEKLHQLRHLGISISIDDFGTGYSSLSNLKNMPFDTLKIDVSFIRDIMTDVKNEAIVVSIIDLANNLHINLVAEGVETIDQLIVLQKLGCMQVQGYFISRPLPASEAEEIIFPSS